MAATHQPSTRARRTGNADYDEPDYEDRLRNAKRKLSYAIGGDWVGSAWFIDSYGLPLLLSTLFTLGALLVVARAPVGNHPQTPRLVRRWATAAVVVMGAAMPVLVPDFWLSFAWGRTLWWGGNPYYDVPAAAVQGLPFDAPILKMTYGPLWAVVAWAVAWVTGGSVVWGTIVFKALMVGSWIAVLLLVQRLVTDRPPREQAMALITIGWLPLGAVQIGGDGHNDAFMLVGILAWVYFTERGRQRWGTLALALSVAVKYVSAPLFLLDFLCTAVPGVDRPSLLQRARAYVPRAALAVAIWLVIFAPFMRSWAFFGETTAVREGRFFLPADGIQGIGTLLTVNLRPVAYAVMGIFPVVTLATVWSYWRSPSHTSFRVAVVGIMLSVLFVAAGHVWPWYVLWLAVPAALLPSDARLARWSTGVLLTAPFTLLYWTAYPHSTLFHRFEAPSLAAYGLALVWMVVAWRLFRPAMRTNT